ncbi:MAG: hypothetical protein IJ658_10725, partial [Kiritimatiellae bacterium]|nr:hypothetical protein [Kiritimatiellia bacterium]
MCWFSYRRLWMLVGFFAAGAGDWFLAVKGAPRASVEFLCGVVCFALAQVCWAAGQLREARPDWRIALALAVPLGVFSGVRLFPVLPPATDVAVCAYAVLTACAFSLAYATRRVFYAWGIGLLCFSDVMIGFGLLRMPGCHALVGPTYVAAELCLLASLLLPDGSGRGESRPSLREARFDPSRRNVWPVAAICGTAAFVLFALAATCYPGGGYNPLMKMLSALGRTVVRGVAYPWCHYLFMAGLLMAAFATASVWGRLIREAVTKLGRDGVPPPSAVTVGDGTPTLPGCRGFATDSRKGECRAENRFPWREALLAWGGAVNVAGLCTIALVPENVNMMFHNAGCHMAAFGGAGVLFARDRAGRDRAWTCGLVAIVSFFGLFLMLHEIDVVPFAPWVTATQKALIVAFALWTGAIAWRERSAPMCRWQKGALLATLALGIVAVATGTIDMDCFRYLEIGRPGDSESFLKFSPNLQNSEPPSSESKEVFCNCLCANCNPLVEDERAALRWLDHVTGKLSPEDEKEWWDIGGTQHGLFAKRYNIAFCGYAAAALGMRGDEAQRRTVGRVLGNCVERCLKKDIWAYSMSKNYWGRKPWAPDPCYRENVMYTGHLLQLMALYETFTGDRRYWTDGFDFVWSEKKRVHYDLKKLIDVTVFQMRHGPNGGVTCEPGFMFFPCNNHPHVALALFARLGHGDWTKDAQRWEKWALSHFAKPLLGGGALNLVYHVRSGIFYPMGNG